jgi:hypothetical protein
MHRFRLETKQTIYRIYELPAKDRIDAERSLNLLKNAGGLHSVCQVSDRKSTETVESICAVGETNA